MVLAFLFLPYLAGYLLIHLKIQVSLRYSISTDLSMGLQQEHYLQLLDLPTFGLSTYIRPEYARYTASP